MQQIYGNTTGLSPHAVRLLERIYRRKVPLDHVATPELVKSLAEASHVTGRQVGALVHRSGEIDYVIVGDATKLMLPDIGRLRAAEGRFRALRLVHTHLYNEQLTRDDIVDLVRLRLDLVAAIQLSPEGEAKSMDLAYNTPPSPVAEGEDPRNGLPYRRVGPLPVGRIDIHFGELITALEDEFARRSRIFTHAKDGRAILVHVAEKSKQGAYAEAEDSLRELAELSRTAGVEVVDTVIQLRDKIDPRLIVGKGKLDDIVLRAAELDAATLVFDRNLTPSQASAISKHADLKVIDRTQLILDIFAQRAESADGKLQVELAQLKYALPRLAMKDDSLSRLTGGIGGRGPGETKLEIGRRRAKERVSFLEAQLKKLSRQREQRRRKRARKDVPIVSIVGYTNAGKSTLLNTLTGSDTIAENKLFATLDTRSRRIRFPEEREVIITDTVGFIRELPKDLFAAFRATFEEAADADLILHVVDASDPAHDQHIATTEELLGELGLSSIPRILVFNKVDLVDKAEARRLLFGNKNAVLVSATNRETTRALLATIADRLKDRWEQARTVPAYDVDEDEASEQASEGDAADASAEPELTTLAELTAGKRYRRTTLRV
ncbi:GTPase HflX [Polyangium jinanense]|uniref:GTPase HflX n=1 Tax=Polyangium jinanense TaxID=2829994 RepID=A0A9X4AVS9_9BACT|nr:GTPase HflX [Polyangium jinanense]MDC3960189.1 GTPase HflX [Polyangium jinanense]MDC3986629.1 GTPase HflX [Polyangium jinanense]